MSEDKKVGRPSKFNDALKEKMLELYERGYTNQQVADFVGVHVRTIENWQAKHQEFMWALKDAKQIADDLVEASLFARAVGYSHEEEKVFCDKGDIITYKTIKQYPPDIGAMTLWLKNRRPEEWREKSEIDINHNDLTKKSKAELEQELQALEDELNDE